MDIDQQAREILAKELDSYCRSFSARQVRAGGLQGDATIQAALRAITAALRAAPEGFALVNLDDYSVLPDTPTEQMLDAGWPDYEMIGNRFDKQGAYADLLAAAHAAAPIATIATVKPPGDLRTELGEAL